MALTIQQIQDNITNGGDVRQIINQLADYVQANPSSPGGDSGLLSKTYAELVTLISGSGLTVGQQYLITDFATKHYIVDSTGTKPAGNPTVTGETEGLILTAVAVNKLDRQARSILYPHDIIYVDFDSTNWTSDISFSNAGTIITGWKGTIYFRHDTELNNYTWYDFRNVKFRRWKTDAPAWSDATTYGVGDYVTDSGFIFKSRRADNLNHATTSEDWWVQLLDLSVTEYWNNNPTSTNGIASHADFDDFKTFADENATYEQCCKDNHFETIEDNGTVELPNTILPNNVFFLHDEGFQTVYSNQISFTSIGNTIGGSYFKYNTIGQYFQNNQIGASFKNNIICTGFTNNAIRENFSNNFIENNFSGNSIDIDFEKNSIGAEFINNNISFDFSRNRTDADFQNNSIGEHFNYNRVGGFFKDNIFKEDFRMNLIGAFFNTNTIGDDFDSNCIGENFNNNTIGNNFQNNNIGYGFQGNTVGNQFQENAISARFNGNTVVDAFLHVTVQPEVVSQDMTLWTLVYADHPKELIRGVDTGEYWIRYIDADGAQQIVTATT